MWHARHLKTDNKNISVYKTTLAVTEQIVSEPTKKPRCKDFKFKELGVSNSKMK